MPNPNRTKRYTLTFDPGNGCLSLQNMVYIFYDIASIASILSFAIQFIASIICVRALWRSKPKTSLKIIYYLLLHTVALALVNLSGFLTAVISYAWFLQLEDTFVNGCSKRLIYPSIEARRMALLEGTSTVSFVLCGLLTNGMVLWRCHQIWVFTLYPRPILVMLIPAGFYLLSLGSFLLNATPPFTLGLSDTPMLLYFSASLALNVILAALIIFRLQACRSQTKRILGNGFGKHYNILTTIFAESAFMNAIMSALIFASIFQNNFQVFGMLYDFWIAITPSVQACSSYLIIYRGAIGTYGSWSTNIPAPEVSTVSFAPAESSPEHERDPSDRISEA